MAMATQTQSIDQHRSDCIDACLDCARICNTCGDDMIGMDMSNEDRQALMARCIRLCRDCADICLLVAQWMGRASALSVRLCAGVCEQHAPHHAMCGECAKECRRCAALCRKTNGGGVRTEFIRRNALGGAVLAVPWE